MNLLLAVAALGYATYLGPDSGASAVAVDHAGFAYVGGDAYSSAFPCTVFAPGFGSGRPFGYVTKLTPAGDAAVWTVCLAGTFGGLALDGRGQVYAASNADGSANLLRLGPEVVVVARIGSAMATALACDRSDNVYVAGKPSGGFWVSAGAFRSEPPAPDAADGFLVKFNASGARRYATFTGTNGYPESIAVDSTGAVWVTGAAGKEITRAFVAKFSPAGSDRPFYISFGGGGGHHTRHIGHGRAIAVDRNDHAYATGITGLPIPVTPGTIDTAGPLSGSKNYLMKLTPSGSTVYSTYLGSESAWGLAVDTEGSAYLARGNSFAVVNADATRLLVERKTYASWRQAVALDGANHAYVAGATWVTAFLGTAGAYLSQYAGSYGSGFAARYDLNGPDAPAAESLVNAASLQPGRSPRGVNGSIAPGELVTIFGSGFDADAQVSIGGFDAPVLHTGDTQINAAVPLGVRVGSLAVVEIRSGGQTIRPFELPVAEAAPGAFRNGAGLLALHEDGSVNSADRPARPGEVVAVFLTGTGGLGFAATVGSRLTEVISFGEVSAGVVEVKVRLPADVAAGTVQVTIHVGDYAASGTLVVGLQANVMLLYDHG